VNDACQIADPWRVEASGCYQRLELSRQRFLTFRKGYRVPGQVQPWTAPENCALRDKFRDEGTPEIIRKLWQCNSTQTSNVWSRLVGRFDVKFAQRVYRLVPKGAPSGREQKVPLSRAINRGNTIWQSHPFR
jgi:hypothetical protein